MFNSVGVDTEAHAYNARKQCAALCPCGMSVVTLR